MTTLSNALLRPTRAALLTERSDRELLDSFVRHRDEDAFADVVRRHGPMVLGVCRRVLRNHPDADDAFQAAFLVLARRAAHLASAEKLANWLHGVALNTARKLRHANLRRFARELPLDADPVAPPAAADDSLAALDDEVDRLPEKYRVVVVLCDLEGRTRTEAARTLGVPEGTVAGRLARARERLRRSLAARGVVPVVAVAAVPNSLVMASARTAAGGVAPLRAAVLADGVISTMIQKNLRTAAVLVAAAVVAVGVSGVRSVAEPQIPPPEPRVKLLDPRDPRPEPAADPAAKTLTAFPLRKLTPEQAAKALEVHAKAGAVLAPAADRTLLVYADEKTHREIERDLVLLGEIRRTTTVVKLQKLKAQEAANTLTVLLKRPLGDLIKEHGAARSVLVPVPVENALLIYADDEKTRQALRILRDLGEPAAVAPAALPKFTVEFRNAPWKDVLEWYSKISGLQIISAINPPGTVTIQPGKNKKFTLPEITDLLNELLEPKKFMLIRREKSFFIWPTGESCDPYMFPRVAFADLPKYGNAELVQVVIPLDPSVRAEDIAAEAKHLLGSSGRVLGLEKPNSLLVMDRVGNIRRMLDLLMPPKTLTAFPLRVLKAEDVVKVVEPLLKPGTVVTPVADDVVLIYADERTKREVIDTIRAQRVIIGTLSFREPRESTLLSATILEVAAGADADKLVRTAKMAFPLPSTGGPTIVAVPAEKRILAYATEEQTKDLLQILSAVNPAVRVVWKAAPAAEPTFTIEFRKVPWADVLDWYAKITGLPFVGDVKPTGNVTLLGGKDKKFTLGEVTDLLNELLTQQKFLLVRREKTFTIVSTDEKIDPSLFRRVELADLPKLGKTELVEVLLPLPANLPVKEHEEELKKMLGSSGQLHTISGRNAVILRDTAGNVLRVQKNLMEIK